MMKPVHILLACALMSGMTLSEAAADESRDQDLVAGQAALEDGFYQVASQRLEQYVKLETVKEKKANAALLLFRAWYGQGRFADIIEWLDENQRVSRGTDFQPGFLFWRAQAEYALGDFDSAIEELERFEKKHDDSEFAPHALRLLALSLRDSGALNESKKAFERIGKKYPDRQESPDNLLDWAGVLIQLDEVDAAEELLVKLVEEHDGTAPASHARLWLGLAAQERRAPRQAADWLEPLTGNDTMDAEMRASAWLALAQTDVERNRMTNALHALEQAELLTTNLNRRVDARIDRARIMMELDALNQAVELLDETVLTLASQPQAALVQRELADMLRARERYEEAADAYQRYLESFTDVEGQRHAQWSRAWCLWELDRYAEAARGFEKAYNAFEDKALKEQSLIKAGDAYFKNGQHGLAAQAYQRAVDEFPETESRARLSFQVAECYARNGDVTNAVSAFNRVMREYEDEEMGVEAMLRLARFYEEQGARERSAETYRSFLLRYSESPRASKAMLEYALLYYRMGEYDQALERFEEVLTSFPDTPEGEKAFFMRGWCRYQLGEINEAVTIGNAFLTRFTNSLWRTEVMFWLAEHAFNSGDYEQAQTNFLEIVSMSPSAPLADDALYWAGRSAVEQKAFEQGINAFTELTRRYTNSVLIPEVRFAQGDALTEIGDFSGAILAFQEIVNLYPGSPLVARAIGRIGDCQFTLGSERPARYQEAIASFRAAMTHPGASRNLALQAEYKLARAYERLGRVEEAAVHNLNVVYDWLAARDSGLPVDDVWFVRSAFAAAKMKENQFAWNEAIAIYRRVVNAEITASRDAELRIEQIVSQLQKAGAAAKEDAKAAP